MSMRRIAVAGSILVALALTGCTHGSSGAWGDTTWWSPESSKGVLMRIGSALSAGAAQMCPERRAWSYGLLFDMAHAASPQRRTHDRGTIMVSTVYPGFPAEQAGIRVGDVLVTVNGESRRGESAEGLLVEIDQLTRSRIQPITLGVDSDGIRRDIDLFAIAVCPVQIEIIEHSGITAVADGKTIRVTTGMLGFLNSEEELAWVLAHELAHNVLEHSQSAQLDRGLAEMLKAGKAEAMPLDTLTAIQRESQADLVAVYILAQAGVNLQRARGVLDRLAALYRQQPDLFHLSAHPAPPERVAAFEQVLHDIQAKQALGERLVPTQ